MQSRWKQSLCCAMTLMGAMLCAPSGSAESLVVFPPEIKIDHAMDAQRMMVIRVREDGVTEDVTAQAQASFEAEGIAAWSEDHRIRPVGDGATTLQFTVGEATVSAAVSVGNSGHHPLTSFQNDVLPAIMRGGCNGGACHGSAQGKNGFHLSLFGYDPGNDYVNLTREIMSRRMNVAVPEESLMLTKPLGIVAHEGGVVMEEGDTLYKILYKWIEEGAKNDPEDLADLIGITLYPSEAVLEGAGAQQRFMVLANYDNGSTRDVTDLAIIAPSDELTLTLDDNGMSTAGDPGEAYVMARFGTFAVVSQVIVLPAGQDFAWPEDAVARNYVDEFVFTKHKKLRVAPAPQAPDHAFMRRAYIDIIGSVPTPEEARAFLEDEDPEKRAKLIDTLLERPEFADVWAMKWADVLQVSADANRNFDRKGMHRYNDWLRAAITSNKPMDELVRELLTAEGGNFTNPASNFYLIESDPTMIAENVAQLFMGIQLQCAQCHNHPFERWTMDDYYSFSAFFSQVGRKSSSDPRETIIFNRSSGEVKNLRDGQEMSPKFLGGDVPEVKGQDRRAVLAEWLTAKENPWFAQNIANRVWEHFFGAGIIDPPDDVRVTNPPSNPQLLDELGRKMIEYDYDLRQLVRDITNSYVYQMDTKARDGHRPDERNLSVARVRRMTAEQMLDSVCKVTDTQVKFPNLPLGASALQVADGKSGIYFLDVFGRPPRDSVCACGRTNEPTLAQSLHLINGDTVNAAIRKSGSRLDQMLAEEKAPEAIIEELYLAAFARPPSEEERMTLVGYVNENEDKRLALEDVFWTVMNAKEFMFNH